MILKRLNIEPKLEGQKVHFDNSGRHQFNKQTTMLDYFRNKSTSFVLNSLSPAAQCCLKGKIIPQFPQATSSSNRKKPQSLNFSDVSNNGHSNFMKKCAQKLKKEDKRQKKKKKTKHVYLSPLQFVSKIMELNSSPLAASQQSFDSYFPRVSKICFMENPKKGILNSKEISELMSKPKKMRNKSEQKMEACKSSNWAKLQGIHTKHMLAGYGPSRKRHLADYRPWENVRTPTEFELAQYSY